MGRRSTSPAWRRQLGADARQAWALPLVRVAVWAVIAVLWLAVWLIGGGWLPGAASAGFGAAATASYVQHRKSRSQPGATRPRQPSRGGFRPAKPVEHRPARPALGTRICSAACQRSTKPANTCDCSCGGSTHGKMVAGSRANLQSNNPKTGLHPRERKQQKARQRAATKNGST